MVHSEFSRPILTDLKGHLELKHAMGSRIRDGHLTRQRSLDSVLDTKFPVVVWIILPQASFPCLPLDSCFAFRLAILALTHNPGGLRTTARDPRS